MPRFKFNLFTGSEVISDPEGSEMPNLEAATRKAIGDCRTFASNELRAGRPFPVWAAMEICDENGRVRHIEWVKDLIPTAATHIPTE
ncbi:DUF6894 family protein [Aureimonas sp. SK2]|uniref:DUF6894 family protein n=1 Tax=Aureimonas sp. SK2 TaxID=3015992 RepID=UPI0024450C2F|nr:hypothetical protein [Aureimonas sp. SK2]